MDSKNPNLITLLPPVKRPTIRSGAFFFCFKQFFNENYLCYPSVGLRACSKMVLHLHGMEEVGVRFPAGPSS